MRGSKQDRCSHCMYRSTDLIRFLYTSFLSRNMAASYVPMLLASAGMFVSLMCVVLQLRFGEKACGFKRVSVVVGCFGCIFPDYTAVKQS